MVTYRRRNIMFLSRYLFCQNAIQKGMGLDAGANPLRIEYYSVTQLPPPRGVRIHRKIWISFMMLGGMKKCFVKVKRPIMNKYLPQPFKKVTTRSKNSQTTDLTCPLGECATF